jgi:hypothetical protein
MDKYEKLGGEWSILETALECEMEERERLAKHIPKPVSAPKALKLGHLTLLPALPDNVFYRRNPDDISA